MSKVVLVLFNARWSLPLRSGNESHLLCWERYSKHRVIYVNVAYGFPAQLVDAADVDAVLFDTIFLSTHWSPEYFRERTQLCMSLAGLDCPKIALVQDEFYNIDLVVDFLRKVGATHVFTCASEKDWRTFYSGLDRSTVSLRTALTGYVDETRLGELEANPPSKRPVALGYRAWNNPYWLGEHGLQKVRIGQVVGEAARRRGLAVDVNTPEATEFLIGEDWYRFLARCRAVLGVEGGASISDHDGSLRRSVESYVAAHPGASFEETKAACFPGRDGEVDLACVSPRHFEACMTRTCQVLLEGTYNGIFEPWRHYIPVKRDYSNIDEVLQALQDDKLVDGIAERAYQDIVASGKWSYRRFVADIEEAIVDPLPARRGRSVKRWLAVSALQARHRAQWRFAHFEAADRRHPHPVYALYRRVASLPATMRKVLRRVL